MPLAEAPSARGQDANLQLDPPPRSRGRVVQFSVEAHMRGIEIRALAERLRESLSPSVFELWSALCAGPLYRDSRGNFRRRGEKAPVPLRTVNALELRGLAALDPNEGPHGALVLAKRR